MKRSLEDILDVDDLIDENDSIDESVLDLTALQIVDAIDSLQTVLENFDELKFSASTINQVRSVLSEAEGLCEAFDLIVEVDDEDDDED